MLTSVQRGDFLIRSAGFLCVVVVCLGAPASVRAAGSRGRGPVGGSAGDAAERQAAARGLFQQGLNNLRAERWSEAADRFERALALKPTPEIAYNLSSALLHLGKLVRASEVLRQAAEDADAPAPVRQAAAARLEQVLPRIGYLTVRLDGPSDGVTVSLDGRPLEAAMLAVPVPVDPTRHSVVAVRGAEPIYEQTLDVGEGERAPLTIVVPTAPPPRTDAPRVAAVPDPTSVRDVAAPSPETAEPARRYPAVFGKVWFWTVVGAVAAGTVTAIVLASRSGAQVTPGTVDTIDYGPRPKP